MDQVVDIDGNVVDADQGGVLDAPNSQEAAAATEQETAPRAPEVDEQAAVMEAAKPKLDYEKSYKELEKTYTRDRQEFLRLQQEVKEQYAPYKDKLQAWAQADQVLSQDPVATRYLQARLQGLDHGQAQSYAEQAQQNPHLEAMYQKVNSLEKFVQTAQQREQQVQVESFLDKQAAAANDLYKQYVGKDMGQAERAAMYNYMKDNNVWNAKAVVSDLFRDQIIEARVQKVLSEQKEKGQKFVQRTDTKNSSAAKAPTKVMSAREALEAAFKEHGVQ